MGSAFRFTSRPQPWRSRRRGFLTPISVRQLQRVGLGSSVEKWRARVGPDSRYFRQDGTPIAPVQVTDSAGWNATFGIHRSDLVTMLAERLPANVIHTGPQRACPWYEGPTSSIQCRCYA